MADRPPNILFLMSDEHRADVTGYEGNGVVRTPVLDELARTGVVFRNAYAPSPICVPGRQCMMAGQLPRTCGCLQFGHDLPPGYMTFARRFSQYAYHTFCCGKLHHQGADQMQGWRSRPFGDLDVSPWAVEDRNVEAFERVATPLGKVKWKQSKEVARAGVGQGPYQAFDQFATQAALRCIEDYFIDPMYDRARPDAPIMLKVSLLSPHYPYFTDRERFDYYLNRVEPFVDQEVFDHPFLSTQQVRIGEDVNQRDVRRATAAYYGMIDRIDSQYGNVLDALREAGQDLDDWIIIYTSDHGEMLGEHGIWEKQKFFEASVRVPLIVRWPKRFEPRVVHENVNLCDLFATLCDLCGLPVPAGLDSRSMVDLMRGRAEGWNNETISQFGFHDWANLMIKCDALKYQYYGHRDCVHAREVLFDLQADPTERRNLIGEARYAAQVKRFRQRLGELGHGPEANPDYRNAGYSM